jgi:hypothetical protein
MSMQDWHEKLDLFLEFNEYEILEDYGKIKKSTADSHAALEYQKFKPIQEANYLSDFDKALDTIRSTGSLPKQDRVKLEKSISSFDKKLKTALNYNPKG